VGGGRDCGDGGDGRTRTGTDLGGTPQGGHAALFASAIAPSDAPELELRGAAATGAPSNLELAMPLAGL
jgi:hypothetical protein